MFIFSVGGDLSPLSKASAPSQGKKKAFDGEDGRVGGGGGLDAE